MIDKRLGNNEHKVKKKSIKRARLKLNHYFEASQNIA
tara:strand:- start:520 stop:630 length:111 start_codon:yes stop_codon:yes gene_type:complete